MIRKILPFRVFPAQPIIGDVKMHLRVRFYSAFAQPVNELGLKNAQDSNFGLSKIVSCHTVDSKPVKQEVNGTVILPPLVFPGWS